MVGAPGVGALGVPMAQRSASVVQLVTEPRPPPPRTASAVQAAQAAQRPQAMEPAMHHFPGSGSVGRPADLFVRHVAEALVAAGAEEERAGEASDVAGDFSRDDCAQSEVSTGYADTHGLGAATRSETSACPSPLIGGTPRLTLSTVNSAGRHAAKDLGGLRAELERLRLQATARKEVSAFACMRAEGPLVAKWQPSALSTPSEDAQSRTSETPLAAAEAALAAAEAALEREEGAAAAAAAAGDGSAIEGLRRQLEGIIGAFQVEHRGRDQLASTVRHLESRMNEGLASIGEVAQARMATDNATDTMLNALRKCVDEISDQCAWPVGHSFAAGAHPASLAQLVLEHDAQLKEVVASQRAVLERQREQHEQMVRLMERQHQLTQEASSASAGVASWQARQETLASSLEALTNMVAGLHSTSCHSERSIAQLQEDHGRLAGSVGEVEAQGRALASMAGDDQLLSNMHAVETQLRCLQAEKSQVADALRAMGEQQQHLRSMQQQVLSAAEEGKAASQGASSALQTSVQSLEQQLQHLQGECGQLASALQNLKGHQDDLRSSHQKHEGNCGQLSAALQSLKGHQEALHSAHQHHEGSSGQLSAALQGLQEQHEALKSAHQGHEEALRSTAERLEEHRAAGASAGQAEAQEVRDEVAAIADAVNMLFGRVNELVQEDSKEQLHKEVSAVAGIVRKLADRIERVEQLVAAARIHRAQHEAESPDERHEASQCMSPQPYGRRPAGSAAVSHRGAVMDHSRRSSSVMDHSRSRSDRPEGAFAERTLEPSQAEMAKSPQAEARQQDTAKELPSSLKAPSPRNWLHEPLSAAIARFDGSFYPSSSQQPQAQSTPNLGSADFLTRTRANDRR